nr:pyridoxal phosphate-dependent aminotransferase family protein [Frigidibacter sp. ROC022]
METATAALTWNVADHQSGKGQYFSDRYAALAQDVERASDAGVWQYFRTHRAKVGRNIEVEDEGGRCFTGVNGASQDYLGLSNDPRVVEASIDAIRKYGAHSAGSAPMGGKTDLARAVEARISDILGIPHVCLFPTGWAAGYGIIKGLVRPHDHIVIDALGHNCLQHGAHAATGNVHQFIHNDMRSLEKRLDRIRRSEPEAAILVVTEALFSMDSDCPDFFELIELKNKYGAMVLLDIAHDFGCLGPKGRGLLTDHCSYSDIDYVIGSFSKTFASIGGFFASNDLASLRGVQGFSGSYTFSNYPIPAQLGAVDAALAIVFSDEGEDLRASVIANTRRLRDALGAGNVETLGVASAMTIIVAGSEARARLAYRRTLEQGVVVNCIEFPAVRRGEARFRVQLTPHHSKNEIAMIAKAIMTGLQDASRVATRGVASIAGAS